MNSKTLRRFLISGLFAACAITSIGCGANNNGGGAQHGPEATEDTEDTPVPENATRSEYTQFFEKGQTKFCELINTDPACEQSGATKSQSPEDHDHGAPTNPAPEKLSDTTLCRIKSLLTKYDELLQTKCGNAYDRSLKPKADDFPDCSAGENETAYNSVDKLPGKEIENLERDHIPVCEYFGFPTTEDRCAEKGYKEGIIKGIRDKMKELQASCTKEEPDSIWKLERSLTDDLDCSQATAKASYDKAHKAGESEGKTDAEEYCNPSNPHQDGSNGGQQSDPSNPTPAQKCRAKGHAAEIHEQLKTECSSPKGTYNNDRDPEQDDYYETVKCPAGELENAFNEGKESAHQEIEKRKADQLICTMFGDFRLKSQKCEEKGYYFGQNRGGSKAEKMCSVDVPFYSPGREDQNDLDCSVEKESYETGIAVGYVQALSSGLKRCNREIERTKVREKRINRSCEDKVKDNQKILSEKCTDQDVKELAKCYDKSKLSCQSEPLKCAENKLTKKCAGYLSRDLKALETKAKNK